MCGNLLHIIEKQLHKINKNLLTGNLLILSLAFHLIPLNSLDTASWKIFVYWSWLNTFFYNPMNQPDLMERELESGPIIFISQIFKKDAIYLFICLEMYWIN